MLVGTAGWTSKQYQGSLTKALQDLLLPGAQPMDEASLRPRLGARRQ
jgi:hypothetical protein